MLELCCPSQTNNDFQFKIDDALLTRCRLRGRHARKPPGEGQAPRDMLRLACGIRSHKEACSVTKQVRSILLKKGIDTTVCWSKQAEADRLVAQQACMVAFREVRPFWNQGMIRAVIQKTLADGKKTFEKKLRNYKSLRRLEHPRKPCTLKHYFDGGDSGRRPAEPVRTQVVISSSADGSVHASSPPSGIQRNQQSDLPIMPTTRPGLGARFQVCNKRHSLTVQSNRKKGTASSGIGSTNLTKQNTAKATHAPVAHQSIAKRIPPLSHKIQLGM